jgi:choline dehydrogenase
LEVDVADEADYIVVGAGSAGCIVANRLAETGARVILLEAGAKDRSPFVRVPGMIMAVHTVPQIKKRFDWGYISTPQQNALGRRIPMTRGKVLGGSSSVNGLLFVRGHRNNYDDWAAEGCTGWKFEDVLPSFKRMEDWEGGESELRGAGGPVKVISQKYVMPAAREMIEAMSETLDIPKNDDYNGVSQEGIGVAQMSAHGGKRFSSSWAYLANNVRPSLTVLTNAAVSRVVIEGGRATGVEILERSGPRVIRATKEVVLSAGVFGSPQILMLSGVGPAAHLREHDIDVHSDLPVGQNLHDHLFVPMTFLAPEAKHRGTAPYFARGILGQMIKGESWFGGTFFDAMAFVRTGNSGDLPDLQLHTLPWSYPSPNQDKNERHTVDKRPALTVFPTLIYPKSRGEVRLASADPTAAPLIDPAYLAEPDDTKFLLDGIKLVREVMASKRLKGVVTGELHPGPEYADDAAMARELPTRIHSVYHPVGTCRMGVDERAVVDPQLRVRGIDGLRVADASIMPTVTGGNTNAPAMMIGEHCAQLMLRAV